MPIIFRCKQCAQKLSVSSRKAGRVFSCPKCNADLKVPQPAAPTSDVPPAQPKADVPGAEATARGNLEKSATATAGAPPRQPPAPPVVRDDDEGGFQLRRARTDTEEMDLTPMVDVTFLLLIFFMITASFSLTKTIETPPPDPEKQGAQQTVQNLEDLEQTSVIVKIDEQDSIFVDDEPVPDPSVLQDLLATKLVSEDKNELVIQASENSRHETFVLVFDAGTGAGMQRIRVATQPADDDG